MDNRTAIDSGVRVLGSSEIACRSEWPPASLQHLLGVGLVVFRPGNEATASGVVLSVAGVAACAVYTFLSSKYLAEASSLSVVLVQQVAAFVFSLVLLLGSLVVADPRSVADVSGTAWLSAIAAGILYYGVAFWFNVNGLKRVRAGDAAIFINLIPVFGLAVSYAVLGERLIARQWVGAVIIIGAVITMTSFKNEPSASTIRTDMAHLSLSVAARGESLAQ